MEKLRWTRGERYGRGRGDRHKKRLKYVDDVVGEYFFFFNPSSWARQTNKQGRGVFHKLPTQPLFGDNKSNLNTPVFATRLSDAYHILLYLPGFIPLKEIKAALSWCSLPFSRYVNSFLFQKFPYHWNLSSGKSKDFDRLRTGTDCKSKSHQLSFHSFWSSTTGLWRQRLRQMFWSTAKT